MLLNHSSVRCVKQKPLVPQWFQNDTKGKTRTGSDVDGTNDLYDQYAPKTSHHDNNTSYDQYEKENSKTNIIASKMNNISNSEDKSGSYRTYWSYVLGDPDQKEDLSFTCYYCNTPSFNNNREEYEKHSVQKHPGKPAYPGAANIKKFKLKAQGQPWEA
jgi:hypothetical protein